ncbi:MAG: MATE family efflux transporter [Eubacteriales bacterium]|nr:MATE family efflux transporter [Eubacteriales bacterium]
MKISIPAILESLFTTMASVIDSKMVSSMGLAAISAISVTNQPRLFVLCVFFAINTTVSSLTARAVGKGDRPAANRLLITALSISLALGAAISALCVVFAEPIMRLCSNQPDTMADSVLYFRIVMGGMLFNIIFMLINAAQRGCGHTKLTLVSNIVSSGVNILLNYMLIEGNWGAPALGIRGAAIATVAGTAAALVVCLAFALRPGTFVSLHYCIANRVRFALSSLKDILGMWKKVVSENLATRLSFLLAGIIAAYTGSFSMSVYSVGMHLMNINFALGSGMQAAAVALVGKSFGAKDDNGVRAYSDMILRMGMIAALVLSVLFIAFGRPYYAFFGDEEAFIRTGMLSCIVIGVISPIQARQIIYNGVFQGTGDVRFTMNAAIISMVVLNAVSFVGTVWLQGGIWGIWAGSLASQLVRMALLQHRYHRTIKHGGGV